nr:G protein-coupled receptor [Proales similis]
MFWSILMALSSLIVICYGEERDCLDHSSLLGSSYWINIKCRTLDTKTKVTVKTSNDYECLSFNHTYFGFSFYYVYGSSLTNSVNFTLILAAYPESCTDRIRHVQIYYYALGGIQRTFNFSVLRPFVRWLEIKYFHMRLLESDNEKANCSNDLDVAIFQVKLKVSVSFNIGVKYDEDVCEQMFNQANIQVLRLGDVANTMIKRNVFAFRQTDAVKNLRAKISTFFLTGYGLKLDMTVFPIKVFSQTKRIILEGTLERFDSRVLISSGVEEIKIFSWGMKKFLHNNLDWLDFANNRSSKNPLKIFLNGANIKPTAKNVKKDASYHRIYDQYRAVYQLDPDYADLFKDNSSFCLFHRLIKKKLNVRLNGFMFELQGQRSCDCTLFWLFNSFMNKLEDVIFYKNLVECDRIWSDLQRDCQIKSMIARCELQTIHRILEPNGYTFVWKMKFTEFVLNTVMASAINCFAVLLNAFVVFVFRRMWASGDFRKKKLTDKSQPMWDYVYFNTFFVLLQALIFALEPLTACIEYDGIYCSPFILTRFAHAFYLFVQSYLGNVFKLMANITNTLFVFYRFGINSDRLAKFRKARPVRMIAIFLVPVLVISVITVFVNDRFNFDMLTHDEFYYLYRPRQSSPAPLLRLIFMLNMILGDAVFNLINLALDLRLLLFLRSFHQSQRKEAAETRVTKMIVLNGLFSFLFRAPEMALSILFIVYSFNPFIFPSCVFTSEPTHSACPSLFKISRLIYSFSFFENFILLFLFNAEFRAQISNSSSLSASKAKTYKT